MQSTVSWFLDLLFFPVCHQQPGMLLQIDSCILPVCDRCAGMYLGVGAVMLAGLFGKLKRTTRYPTLLGNLLLLTLAGLMVLEWGMVRTGSLAPDSTRRFVTGLFFGITAGIYFQIYWNRTTKSILTSSGLSIAGLLWIVGGGLVAGELVRWEGSAVWMGAILSGSFVWFWLRVNMLVALRVDRQLGDFPLRWTLVGSSLLIVEVAIVLILK